MITIRQQADAADLSLATQLKMKILHALVGYLAATAFPFPSHLFAFASPLEAISNYDGYVPVNTTLNSDGAVMKRGPGDIIETRQAAIIIPAALFVFNLIVAVVASIFWVEHDDPVRGSGIMWKFTLITKSLMPETCGVYPK